MRFGVQMMVTDESIAPGRLAAAAEDAGFDALLVSEQTHIPTSRRTPYPGGTELPPHFYRTLDPFVALTAAAATTSRLLVGTGVCLAPQHDPILLAKTTATLDHLSGGRFVLGVGAGWNIEQMEAHGVDPDRRFQRLRETVLAVRALWTEDPAEFHGEQIDIAPSHQFPKPVRDGGPPVLVGGRGPRVLERVLDYGDGWLPNPGDSIEVLGDRIAQLRQGAIERGRSRPEVWMYRATAEPEAFAAYAAAGVDHCVLALATAPEDVVLPEIERLAGVVAAYRDATGG